MENLFFIFQLVAPLFFLFLAYMLLKKQHDDNEEKSRILFDSMANQQREEMLKRIEEREEKLNEKNLKSIDLTLQPFKEHLTELKEKINKSNIEQAKQTEIFKSQVSSMLKVTENMQEDANNLAKALKGDSKIQGDWGEKILARTLEASGLQENLHYVLQDAQEDIEGARKIPDAIVKLPRDRHIVIDSKVSLRAYEKYMSTDDPKEKETYLKKLINDVKDRIKELKGKDYTSLPDINSADYIFIFFPIEGAYNLVVQSDWDFQILASENRMVFTTPTNLMGLLRMAENIWRLDQQNQNADLIASRAGLLIDKFTGLVEDLNQLGKNIKNVERSYDGARRKLDLGTGNIFNQIEDLEKLGAKNKKALKKPKNPQLQDLKKDE